MATDNEEEGFVSEPDVSSDSWRVRKRIIAFCYLPSPHTGKNIAEAIFHRLVMWNLDKKTFTLTLDNAASNDVCIRELLNTPFKDTLPVQGNIFHQRCSCHILNLIVQDGLDVLSPQIDKIRETMKYIRHSQSRVQNFELAALQVKGSKKRPSLDVATRWNSTYLMLELALELRPVINRFACLDRKYTFNPSDDEWDQVSEVVGHLKVFYVATLKLSGTKYPTLNLFFPEYCEVYLCIKKMEDSQYPFIVQMGKEMFTKWNKYWTGGNTLLALACVLDPRCKLAVVEYYFDMIYPSDCDRFVGNLKVCFNDLFKEYLEAHSKCVQSQAGTSSQFGSGHNSSVPCAVSNTRAGLKDFMKGKKTGEAVKSEMEQYLSDPLDESSLDDAFDIIAWWKVNSPKYHVLSKLCRDILAVPISTVASEATFSTSGRTLSYVRNCLNNESMEALICAQDWLRASITDSGGEIGDPLWITEEAPADGPTE